MPYIDQESRKYFEKYVENLPEIGSAGELNYYITQVIKKYWEDTGIGYVTIAVITGVLENVKNEFYRRVAVPYEIEKIEANGDVY